MTMRVYRFDPSKRPEPRNAVMPPLPHCEVCGVCLGETVSFREKHCDDCRRSISRRRVRQCRKERAEG